jgi:hypothetical protein
MIGQIGRGLGEIQSFFISCGMEKRPFGVNWPVERSATVSLHPSIVRIRQTVEFKFRQQAFWSAMESQRWILPTDTLLTPDRFRTLAIADQCLQVMSASPRIGSEKRKDPYVFIGITRRVSIRRSRLRNQAERKT